MAGSLCVIYVHLRYQEAKTRFKSQQDSRAFVTAGLLAWMLLYWQLHKPRPCPVATGSVYSVPVEIAVNGKGTLAIE